MSTAIGLAIVADDLSGAADTAAGFLATGHRPRVRWGQGAALFDSLSRGEAIRSGVVAVDTGTRRGSAERARCLTFAAVDAAREAGIDGLFKKIDSTLRGHVAEEVAAALDAWYPGALAIVAPAFVEMGRTTRGGRQLVSDTAIARPSIVAMLEASGVRAENLNVAQVRGVGLLNELTASRSRGTRALVCDAETSADLSLVAEAGLAMATPIVWVGSAGLARALAAKHAVANSFSTSNEQHFGRLRGPVLLVVGSANTVSGQQAEVVVRAGASHVAVPHETLGHLAATDIDAGWVQRVKAELARGRDVVVTIGSEGFAGDDERLVRRLSSCLKTVEEHTGGLVVTGGETAAHLFSEWGVSGLDLVSEVEPGVPAAFSVGRSVLPVVTKAGGFGSPFALERARQWIKEESSRMFQRKGEAQ